MIFSILTIILFNEKKEYVIAIFLVGQPLLKLILIPFTSGINPKIFLLYYLLLGFVFFIYSNIQDGKLINENKKKFQSLQFTKVKDILNIDKFSLKTILTTFSFGIFMSLYIIISPEKFYGLTKILDFFTIIFLIVLLSNIFLVNTKDVEKLLRAITNISLFIGVITIILIFFHTGGIIARLGTSVARDIKLFEVNFAVSIWFGRRIGLGFLSSLYLTKLYPTKKNKIKTSLLFVLTLLSVSRGPLIAIFVCLLLIIFKEIKKIKNYKRIIKYIISTIIIFSSAVAIYLTNTNYSYFGRLFNFGDNNALTRIHLYDLSIKQFISNPLGIGLGGFASFGGIHKYPHNIFLEILVELGILGFIFFIIIVLKSFIDYKQYVNKYKDSRKIILIQYSIIVLIFAIINALFSGDIGSNEYIWFAISLVAILKNYEIKNDGYKK